MRSVVSAAAPVAHAGELAALEDLRAVGEVSGQQQRGPAGAADE